MELENFIAGIREFNKIVAFQKKPPRAVGNVIHQNGITLLTFPSHFNIKMISISDMNGIAVFKNGRVENLDMISIATLKTAYQIGG